MTDRSNHPRFHLFAGLDPAGMDEIMGIVTVEGFRRGEFLLRPGESSHRLFLLHHGTVKVSVFSDQGQEKILYLFYPGDAFGGLLCGAPPGQPRWVQALNDVIVSCMDETAFKAFIQRYPDLCMNLIRYLVNHHMEGMRRMERFIHTPGSHRLVITLLELGQRLGQGEAEQFELDPIFTQQNLADMVGLVRSTVSSVMSQLQRRGVISRQGRRIIVHRRAAERFLLDSEVSARQTDVGEGPHAGRE